MDESNNKFDKHEASNCHKAAMTYELVLPTCGNTAKMLYENQRKNREQNRHNLLIVLEAIKFLARQGLLIRVKEEDKSNLRQIFRQILI